VVAAKVESDDTTKEDSTEEETDSELNIWLLASSIAVAAVLVLAVASIIVRKIVEKYKKKHGARARKTVKEKKAPAAKKVEKKVDEDSPYND
jgi:flagellar biosynthesis/type III secretory pathway M-ring protein FliF/YscJ